ncbi:MAG: tetratricopeptide repeat protein [Planctomycetes bacterium]|nr:tetratricopeptide repeat protein [Planctomycetota bacterium]
MAKPRVRGRFCHKCGRRRPNEAFSGTGHARCICRECERREKKGRKERAAAQAAGEGLRLFEAEAAYGQSVFRQAIGDVAGSIDAAERCLEALPTYAPGLLTMGSIEYQRERRDLGRAHFERLLELPPSTEDLAEILDEAGEFLIDRKEYADGLALYRCAAGKFPEVAALWSGLSCCAGHLRRFEEAIEASRKAVNLAPGNARCLNDLGWSLLEAGDLGEAREVLRRAVEMAPEDGLARGNLALVEERLARVARAREAIRRGRGVRLEDVRD